MDAVPAEPGVYIFSDAKGVPIYVGKAKNLRHRLRQYRAVQRRREDRRMRRILVQATHLRWEVTASNLDALLLETRLIQSLRPALNVANAFSHQYRFIGVMSEADQHELRFCLTREPEANPGYDFFGAFRSRSLTIAAFFAMARLLGYVGHRERSAVSRLTRRTYVRAFRQVPVSLRTAWRPFLAGESSQVLGDLVLALLERPDARAKATDIQEDIDVLRAFWQQETAPLAKVIAATGFASYPVPQQERDILFIRYRDMAID